MVLTNITKNTVLADDLKIAKTIIDNILGLLKDNNSKSMFFKTRFGLHTFGLKEKIDILVLNHQFKIIKIGQSIKPNHFFFWHPKYFQVIELSENTVLKTNTKIGDYIKISYI